MGRSGQRRPGLCTERRTERKARHYYGKEGHERLRNDIDFLDEIDAAIEEGDMSQAHQLVGDWRKELDDYLALNEKECGTHDDGAGDEAAVAKTKE